ncbi:MAG TPA: GDP-mannose 4,6-dehydratase, partial [Vicinamibacterales bacterium]|nr:GDP-mannose 4,6-dehydratase [Vicinamibacterales bacterium]
MRVLITGGAGFVGSHLSEALLAAGHHVHIVDDLSTGSIDNVSHLKAHAHFGYTIDTVFNEQLTAELVD